MEDMEMRDLLKVVGVVAGLVIWGWSEVRKQNREKKERQRKKAAKKEHKNGDRKRRTTTVQKRVEPSSGRGVAVQRPAAAAVAFGGEAEGNLASLLATEKAVEKKAEETDVRIVEEESKGGYTSQREVADGGAMDLRTMVIYSELLKPKYEEY